MHGRQGAHHLAPKMRILGPLPAVKKQILPVRIFGQAKSVAPLWQTRHPRIFGQARSADQDPPDANQAPSLGLATALPGLRWSDPSDETHRAELFVCESILDNKDAGGAGHLLAMWQHLSERVAEEREEGLAALVVRLWGRATTALTAHDRADGEETKEGEGGGSKEGEGEGGGGGEAVTRLPKGGVLSAVAAKGLRALLGGGGAPEACHSALLSLLDVVQAGGGGSRVARSVWGAVGEQVLMLLRSNRWRLRAGAGNLAVACILAGGVPPVDSFRLSDMCRVWENKRLSR